MTAHVTVVVFAGISDIVSKPFRRNESVCFIFRWKFYFCKNQRRKVIFENIQFNGIIFKRNTISFFWWWLVHRLLTANVRNLLLIVGDCTPLWTSVRQICRWENSHYPVCGCAQPEMYTDTLVQCGGRDTVRCFLVKEYHLHEQLTYHVVKKKIGKIPIGRRGIPAIQDIKDGAPVRVRYNPGKPKHAYLPNNNGVHM